MLVHGKPYQAVWASYEEKTIYFIDQTKLPFQFEIQACKDIEELIVAIKKLAIRGAPAIGIAAAYGTWLITEQFSGNQEDLMNAYERLIHARPTAVNLVRGAQKVLKAIEGTFDSSKAFEAAQAFAENEIAAFRAIGQRGMSIIGDLHKKLNRPVHILTHCNAGWLACGDYGSALAPIFEAHKNNIPIKVFADETQPLLQGARLTAWELYHENIPFAILPDNNAGLLMAKGEVDVIITGADRIAYNGDAANKIGTYTLAVLADYHHIPFYIAAPLSTFDFQTPSGSHIPIEERSAHEVIFARVWDNSSWRELPKTLPDFPALNFAFDVTPHHLISGYITEKGIIYHPRQLFD